MRALQQNAGTLASRDEDPLTMKYSRSIPSPSVDEMSLDCLVGRRLTSIDTSGVPGCWLLHFGDAVALSVEAPWRLVSAHGITIANIDHEEMFGHASPVDAVARLVESIGSRPVLNASAGRLPADLTLDFGDHWRFEVFAQSCGYESWTLWKPDGTQLVGMGGGHIAAYRENAG